MTNYNYTKPDQKSSGSTQQASRSRNQRSEGNAEDPEEVALTQAEQEFRERILNDNQVQSALSVIKGIKVYKKLTEQPSNELQEIEVAATETSSSI